MQQTLLLVGVFLGTVALLVGVYVFVNRRSLSATDTALARLRDVEEAQQVSIRSILRDVSVSDLPIFDRVLAGRGITTTVAEQLTKAGLDITPGSFLLRMAISSILAFVLIQAWLRYAPLSTVALVVGALLPWVWVERRRTKRIEAFQGQLPDAIDMLVSAMKAGYSFQAAMKFIGEELPEPLGPEFLRFYEEQRLGLEVRTALLTLQARVDSIDLKMFVTAILIQRETGGNLSEVLDKISGLMRERSALRGEIDSLTAESRLSARILGSLPFVVFGAINLVNPGFISPMLKSDIGPWIFGFAAVSVTLGYWMMMSIADIDI